MTAVELLARRLDGLERRIAAVDGRTGRRSEAMQASYLTVDPATGLIGADFSGKLSAQGIDFHLGDTPTDTTAQIRWLDAGGGAKLIDTGYVTGGDNIRDQVAYSPGSDYTATLHQEAAEGLAHTSVYSNRPAAATPAGRPQGHGPLRVLDSNGGSGFVLTSPRIQGWAVGVTPPGNANFNLAAGAGVITTLGGAANPDFAITGSQWVAVGYVWGTVGDYGRVSWAVDAATADPSSGRWDIAISALGGAAQGTVAVSFLYFDSTP